MVSSPLAGTIPEVVPHPVEGEGVMGFTGITGIIKFLYSIVYRSTKNLAGIKKYENIFGSDLNI